MALTPSHALNKGRTVVTIVQEVVEMFDGLQPDVYDVIKLHSQYNAGIITSSDLRWQLIYLMSTKLMEAVS